MGRYDTVKVCKFLNYLQGMVDTYNEFEEKYGAKADLTVRLGHDLDACELMLEEVLGIWVDVLDDGTVTLG